MTDVLLPDALPGNVRSAIDSGVSRTICPKCDGGTTRESSLSVWQNGDGIIRLKCYRASCGWYALSMSDPDARLQTQAIKPARVYRDEIMPLAYGQIEKQLRTYYVHLNRAIGHGWGQNERGDTLIMPVLSPYGEVRGHVTRTFDTPKRCYTYKATAQPWLDWWADAAYESRPLVIVEDCISALRLAGLGYPAVALLGTSISTEQAREIREHSPLAGVYLVLDRDAFEKALYLTRKHSHILRMKPVCLDADIKNMKKDSDIHRLFEDSNGRDQPASRTMRIEG